YRLAEALGHSLVPQTPALVSLVLADNFHVPLSGVSQEVELTVRAENVKSMRLRGSLLWTHFGVSGPVVLHATPHWYAARRQGRAVSIAVNFLAGDDVAAADRRLLRLAGEQPRTSLRNALASLLPARLVDAMLAKLQLPHQICVGQLSREARRKL